MPSVESLLSTISDLSLVGSGDSSDTSRIMRYMNLTYQEAYRETAQEYPTLLLTTVSVGITAGSGTLPATPFVIERVKDTATNRILEPITLLELEELYPALDGVDAPAYYYIEGLTGLKTYPTGDATVSVRYIPLAATLTSSSAESDIKIPPAFHDLLVHGTLLYMAYDERDKGFSAEVGTAKARYDTSMNSFRRWLNKQQTQTPLRTRAVLA